MTTHVLDLLPLWVEGDLDATTMAGVENHLAQCPACRQAAEALRTSQVWLREATASPFGPGDQDRLHRSVMGQIRAESTPRPLRPTLRPGLRPALLAACAASLLVGTMIWRRELGSEAQAPLLTAPPATGAAELPSPAGLRPKPADHQVRPLPHPRGRPASRQDPEPSPSSEPSRIEFQTADPNIRIIWLARAKPLPEANPPIQEAP